LLRYQVEALMLAGLGFTFLAALSLSRCFGNDYRKRGPSLWFAASIGLVGALFFCGWAWTGGPLRFWGL
jgi:hypothetical protein